MNEFVKVKNVSKTYISGHEKVFALENIDLEICKQEYLAIIGPSGAGKSTLLHIIGGLDRPSSGEVFIAGESIYGLRDNSLSKKRARTIGFVFQFYHLLEELTVWENVAIGGFTPGNSAKTAFKRAEELLKCLGIGEKKNFLPGELSGGQKQRVALARALINDPELLLCDEPTGSLDDKSAGIIISLLSTLHREEGKTIVLVTHNKTIAESAQRVLCIKSGKLSNCKEVS